MPVKKGETAKQRKGENADIASMTSTRTHTNTSVINAHDQFEIDWSFRCFAVSPFSIGGMGTTGACTYTLDELPADDWRYRYNTSLEREQKRQYATTMPPGTLLPWTYYLLGPDNAQLAVWHGMQGQLCDGSDENTACGPTSWDQWPRKSAIHFAHSSSSFQSVFRLCAT